MLGWEEASDVPEEASGEHVDHFEGGLDIDVHLRTVTKGKSKIRQNAEGTTVAQRLAYLWGGSVGMCKGDVMGQ